MATTKKKLNVLLAVTDHLAGQFKSMVDDYCKFFKSAQGAFKGERKTYTPNPDTIDDPTARGTKLVVTTVDEKLKYFELNSGDYIDALLSQEATNASGNAKAELVVDGVSFGKYSSLELLRMKSLLEGGNFKHLYETISVRNDDEIWTETSDDAYANRSGIFASTLVEGSKKTTLKESYILNDPNIGKIDGAKYTPQLAQKDTTVELGKFSHQRFSGEWSHRQRAELLSRRDKFLLAITEALKLANEAETVGSDMTAEKLFNYLHRGAAPTAA
jgi:hypothetical protein